MVGTADVRRLHNCPACGQIRWTVVGKPSGKSRKRFEEYSAIKYRNLFQGWSDIHDLKVARCRSCSHSWYLEIPCDAQLAKMYEVSMSLSASEETGYRAPRPDMVKRMQVLRRLVGGQPSLLDFGAGSCRWSVAAAEAGFSVTAFEPNSNRSFQESQMYQVVDDLKALQGKRYSVVHMEQVLEHVPDPMRTLEDVRPLLADDGLLVLRVPNLAKEEWVSDVWGTWPFDGRHPHIMAPFEHIQGFTPRSLETLVRRAKFTLRPAWALLRYLPVHVVYRILGRMVPSAGQTQVIAQKGNL